MHVALATTTDLEIMDQDDDVLGAALERAGASYAMAVWDDPWVDWSTFDVVVIRSTWDYTSRRDEFVAWAAAVEEAGALLCNSAEVVRWNTHKGYLIELEERGAPIVPTAWLGKGDEADLAELAASRRWAGVVAKPVVAAGSEGLLVATGDLADHQTAFDALLAEHDVMVQPLLKKIRTDGELSLICIDGEFSHAIRKVPASGDIRSQVEFGGHYSAVDPEDDLIALAEWLVEATGHDLLYARVDLMPEDDGAWVLGELEATEPALYLDHAEGAADRMAAAILARASR